MFVSGEYWLKMFSILQGPCFRLNKVFFCVIWGTKLCRNVILSSIYLFTPVLGLSSPYRRSKFSTLERNLSLILELTIHCLCYFRIKLFSRSITENIQPGSMLEQSLRYAEIILNDAKPVEDMKNRQDVKKNIRIPRLTGIDSKLASDFVHWLSSGGSRPSAKWGARFWFTCLAGFSPKKGGPLP